LSRRLEAGRGDVATRHSGPSWYFLGKAMVQGAVAAKAVAIKLQHPDLACMLWRRCTCQSVCVALSRRWAAGRGDVTTRHSGPGWYFPGKAMVQCAVAAKAMDLRAKAKLVDTAGLALHVIPFEGWMCYIGSRKIIKQWQLTLWEHINGNKLCQHWQCKQRFGRGASKQVDWTSIRQAMTEVGWSRRKWVTKFTSGEFPHGANMQRWHFRTSSKCPQCSQE